MGRGYGCLQEEIQVATSAEILSLLRRGYSAQGKPSPVRAAEGSKDGSFALQLWTQQFPGKSSCVVLRTCVL
jgi:hypothetical protein